MGLEHRQDGPHGRIHLLGHHGASSGRDSQLGNTAMLYRNSLHVKARSTASRWRQKIYYGEMMPRSSLTVRPAAVRRPGLSMVRNIRPFLLASVLLLLAGCGSGAAGSGSGGGASGNPSSGGGSQDVTIVVSVREVAGAYHAAWVKGAEAFATSVGANYKTLVSGDDSQNQLTQIQSLLSTTKGKVVLNIDPNTSSILQAIVNDVQKHSNAYLVSQWNKPDNYKPWGTTNRWVAFISYDGVDAGYQTAKALFSSMGGKGSIVSIQGILDNVSNQLRYQGLQKALAEFPNIKMLATQPADWDPTKANTVMKTFLAKYGKQIAGVWGADDGTAIGAESALKAGGRAEVPVVSAAGGTPEAFASIATGKGVIATTDPDPYWQGSTGSAIGYYAAIGKTDVAKLTHEQRAFYAKQELVTPKNVKAYEGSHTPASYLKEAQPDTIYSRMVGPVTN